MFSSLLLPSVLSILLVIATVLGAGMIVPQVVHLHRRRDSSGVSGAWVGVGAVLNIWWVVYAIAAQRWGLLPVSVASTVLYAAIAWLLSRIDGIGGLDAVARGAIGVAVVPAIGLAAGGWAGAGIAIGLTYGVQFAPAALTAVRSATVSGISGATWLMAFIEAVIWFVYGTSLGDWALLIGGGGGALMASVILVRLAVGEGRVPRLVAG
jgi:uncharacterized protein with PQ loop repeat